MSKTFPTDHHGRPRAGQLYQDNAMPRTTTLQPVDTVTCNSAHACTEYRVHVYADGSAQIQTRGQTSNRFVTRVTLSAIEWIALDAGLDYEGAYINDPAPLARACNCDD